MLEYAATRVFFTTIYASSCSESINIAIAM